MSHLNFNQRVINTLWTQIQKLPMPCKALKTKVQTLQIQNNKLRHRVELLSNRTPAAVNTLECNRVELMDAFYSNENHVQKYHAPLRRSVYELFLELLAKKIEITKNTKVLDAACGLGIFTDMVKQKFQVENISGFDFSKVAIKKACSRYKNIDFFPHDIYAPLSERYDVIICMETIEHLTNPEKAVHNLLLSLAQRGSLFLTVPDGRIDYSSRHIHFWSPESWTFYVKKLSDGIFAVDTGVIQHPTKATLRYNWAIITSVQKKDKK